MNEFPTPWQQKMMWSALAALSVVAIGAIAVGLIWLISNVIGFLQPILIPFAVAAVMAYLLEPVVSWIVRRGTSRHRAVISVFALVTIALAGVMVWIIPAIWMQTANLGRKMPTYRDRIEVKVQQFNDWARSLEQRYGVRVLPEITGTIPNPLAGVEEEPENAKTGKNPSGAPRAVGGAAAPAAQLNAATAAKGPPPVFDLQNFLNGDWLRTALPVVARNIWHFITNSVGGFLGAFGFLLSMVIVPIYLYYFLIEAKNISESWGDYLPLRASAFKDEVVSALNEINGYLIAFFRGQLLVSLINGAITSVGLMVVGLDFGLLIGITLCFLGLIPYLGIILCWIPAVIIASVQPSPWFLHGTEWWVFPVVVTGIFVAVNQLDGLVVTPKIVGGSVGLHPMTVIASVFVWSLLLGGLLGAILAVPLTATVKVLLRRYIWQRRLISEPSEITEETFSVQQAQDGVDRFRIPRGEMSAPQPRVIIPNTSKRDTCIAIVAGLLVLAFIGYGVMHMASPVTGNKLIGVVVGRQFTPFKERQVSFNGRKIEGAEEIDGEYVLKVRVDATHRTYEVPVEKPIYEAKKDGDSLTFIRPPSEQR